MNLISCFWDAVSVDLACIELVIIIIIIIINTWAYGNSLIDLTALLQVDTKCVVAPTSKEHNTCLLVITNMIHVLECVSFDRVY